MNGNVYAATAGIILSLGFSYVPKLKDWYNAQSSQKKQLIMLGLIFLAIAGRFGLGCLGKDTTFQCNQDGVWLAAQEFAVAMVFNQGTYKATNYIGTGKK